jgi:hypothetical protein
MGSALPRPEGLLKMEYVPREQFVPFHKRKQRHSVLVTHRRCGKTVASICDLIGKAIKHPLARQGFEGGRFAYIATTYAAGKDIAWEMLKAYSRPSPNCRTNPSCALIFGMARGSRFTAAIIPTPCAAAGSTWSS